MENKEKKTITKKINKFVIFIAIDDEIYDIHEKLIRCKAKTVYLVVPKNALIFQSIINLKLLKKYVKDNKKNIYIITHDQSGIFLSKKIGIKLFESENKETFSFFTSFDENENILPLKASVNSIDDHAPMRLSKKKLSISEILRTSRQPQMNTFKRNKKTKSKNFPKIKILTPNKAVLFALISFIIIILVTIFYIALPSVTIYLTPSASVLEKFVNITLADYNKNQYELETHPKHMLASNPISVEYQKTITYFSTGKKVSDKGQNSSGNIQIINKTSFDYPLIARTRFQTADGVVFRLQNPITVPASKNGIDGTIDAFVQADELDSYGMIVGDRGNIGPENFFLPGLSEENQKNVYAVSNSNMEGGVSDFISFVTEEDINAAKQKLESEIIKESIVALKSKVEKISEDNEENVEYILLEGENAVKLSDVKYTIDNNLEDAVMDTFEVSASINISGLYYDHDAMLEILKAELITQKSPNKELLRINEDTTSYKIFNWDDAEGKVKLTANIKGIEQYQIDSDTEIGDSLQKKIRDHIKGKNIEDAKDYIQNLSEINKVSIESWPVWAPTIPNITENIKFDVREVITVD